VTLKNASSASTRRYITLPGEQRRLQRFGAARRVGLGDAAGGDAHRVLLTMPPTSPDSQRPTRLPNFLMRK